MPGRSEKVSLQMIKVLLVEDEPLWQHGIAALINSEPDMTLCSTVDNADDAEIFASAEQPDIILLDWKIRGDRDGLELGAALSRHFSPSQMILVTGSPPEQIPDHPFGYVPKPRIASDLIPAIRSRLAEQQASQAQEPVETSVI